MLINDDDELQKEIMTTNWFTLATEGKNTMGQLNEGSKTFNNEKHKALMKDNEQHTHTHTR